MVIALDDHARAVLTRLGTVTFGPSDAALKVGDAVAPLSTDGSVVAPCAVLYGRDGGTLMSSVGCLDTDGTVPFQITSVGRNASEARAVADKTHAALVASPLSVDGRKVTCRPQTGSGQVLRDDDLTPPLFYVTKQYRLLTFTALVS